MKIALTGASGLVGKHLIRMLLHDGHEIYALVRTPSKLTLLPEANVFAWEHTQQPNPKALSGCDAVIHLAGEGIADKLWSADRKRALMDSRRLGTQNLVRALAQLPEAQRPKIFISTSAVGYYGNAGERECIETDTPGTGFLSEICQEWEAQAAGAQTSRMRTVIMRLGIVLARDGGFLNKMAPVVMGSGKQWLSWIHIEDFGNFVKMALQNQSIEGPFNLTSPNPVTNRAFTKLFSRQMKIPMTVTAPAFVLKVVLGEMSTVVLGGQKALPKRLLEQQFQFHFQFPLLERALADIYGRQSFLDSFYSADQFVPLSRKEVFTFFSRAENLETITPPWLNFKITKKSRKEVAKDVIIDYRLKIHGVPMRWKSLISEWEPEKLFVDDQLRGPYNKWHHIHRFESVIGGTLLRDEVTYRVPGSFIGKLFLSAWIRKDVSTIFSYRQKVIRELLQQGKIV